MDDNTFINQLAEKLSKLGTVTFPKRFSNTNYIFVVTPNEAKASGATFARYTENKTTSTITSAILGSSSSAPKHSWYAAGF